MGASGGWGRLARLTGPAVTVAVAALVWVAIDQALSARAARGVDAAQQLAPVYPYIGVDSIYIAARALGFAALILGWLSVLSGLLPRTGRPSSWSWLGQLHRPSSLLVVVLAAAHAALPYLSVFPPYGGWRTAVLPLAQPYSWGTTATYAESAGILGLLLFALLGPTYYLAGRWRHGWAIAHRFVLAGYLLAVGHALVMGSDLLIRGYPRVTLVGAQVPLLIAAGLRLHRAPIKSGGELDGERPRRTYGTRVATATLWLAAGILLAATIAGLAGWSMEGLPLGSS